MQIIPTVGPKSAFMTCIGLFGSLGNVFKEAPVPHYKQLFEGRLFHAPWKHSYMVLPNIDQVLNKKTSTTHAPNNCNPTAIMRHIWLCWVTCFGELGLPKPSPFTPCLTSDLNKYIMYLDA